MPGLGKLNQDEFVAKRRPGWTELEGLLLGDKELYRLLPTSISRAASLYRTLCADLMYARSAGYTPELIGFLDALGARAHNALYGTRPVGLAAAWNVVAREFPRTLRRRWGFQLMAWLLFLGPLMVGLIGALYSTEFAGKILPPEQLAMMAEMYSEGFEGGRSEGVDASMAGFYVRNNVGIAFRCFATGILFGAGSMFFLIYNGLSIGTTTGHVIHVGHGENILTFMCGHGPFELTAIIIAGGAGLQMGYALVATQGKTRIGSLRAAAPELGHLVIGAGVMLVIAAFIEGFWSPSGVAPPIKWAVSAINTLFVIAWLTLGGRGARAADGRPATPALTGAAPTGEAPRVAAELTATSSHSISAGLSPAASLSAGRVAEDEESPAARSMTGMRLR